MPDLIRLLPDVLANQIAAGEVVQRPASVVKEMLENSIDAQATSVQLIVERGGTTLIQVIDDGTGMSATDARMCFERHATSKIQSTDDLFSIRTFGFRGEAMASIAAVAQVELKPRRAEDEVGTRLYIERNQIKSSEPIQQPQGTSIAVKNLFFSTPARRKFLKSETVEFRHIAEEFQRVALAYPETEMRLTHNGNEIHHLPSSNLGKRIVGLLGKNYQKHLIPCQESVTHAKLKGYIGHPDIARKTRGEQFLFVNNRFVKHPYFHHAVMTAYADLLREGYHPFYALFLELDPRLVDINVHPAKTEVKFEDERTLYSLIQATLRKALGTQVAASLDFEIDYTALMAKPTHAPPSRFSPNEQKKQQLRHWERLYAVENEERKFLEDFIAEGTLVDQEEEEEPLFFSSAVNTTPPAPASGERRWVFQIGEQYIVSPVRSGILLLDQQKAHERILYEQFIKETGTGYAQQLMFPVVVQLNAADMPLVEALQPQLEKMGFSLTLDTQKQQVTLTGVPSGIEGISEDVLLQELLEQYKERQELVPLAGTERQRFLAECLARKSAIKSGQSLTPEEMKKIIDLLFATQNHDFSLDGERIHTFLDKSMMAQFLQ